MLFRKAKNDLTVDTQAEKIPVPPILITGTVRRAYTQADLDAAVKDIRCGRLGTRRASVVYGVPRL